MRSAENTIRVIGGAMVLFSLVMAAWQHLPIPGPGPAPDPEPEPNPVVESPFPAEGYWLLIASEADEEGAKAMIAANAEAVRKEPDLENRWHDYSQTGLASPWQAALDWARQKSSGKPYYVARKGGKAAEGPLTGGTEEMLKAITAALEGIR